MAGARWARLCGVSLPSRDISTKCGGRRCETDSKSFAYENRTKNAKCGGLETNGPRERISSPERHNAVRSFCAMARGYRLFQRGKTRRRMLASEELAEGDELGSNVLHVQHRYPLAGQYERPAASPGGGCWSPHPPSGPFLEGAAEGVGMVTGCSSRQARYPPTPRRLPR
jgi:hypothetical protein